MTNNKKGGAKLYALLALAAVIVLAVAWRIVKLNWTRFKAETDYAFSIISIVAVAVLIIIFLIWFSIRRARRKREKERARLEKERLEAERIAAGGKPSTLGNGKLEMSDVSEVAGKAIEKVDEFVQKGE